METIEGQRLIFPKRSNFFDSDLVFWDSNIVYHFLFWLTSTPIIMFFVFFLKDFIYSDNLTYDYFSTIELLIVYQIFPIFLVIPILVFTIVNSTILRIQIDQASGVILWEELSLLNTTIVHRKLSDLQAILQPRQSPFFRKPAKLIFLDGVLPLEIRKPVRLRKNDLPQNIADMTGMPIVANTNGS